MVLFGIVGELGAGKTLALSYLAWTNWFRKGRKIYSNYNLYGIPFTKVKSIPDLEKMQQGFFAGDELWLWIDSWASKSAKANLISSILLKSRKRELTLAFTTQSFGQINVRIRNITDFLAYPMMSVDNRYTRVNIFRGGNPSLGSMINPPIYFNNYPIYAIYNTCEEVFRIEENSEEVEHFFHVRENVSFVRFLKAQGFSDSEVMKECDNMEKVLNPEGIRSEEERKKEIDYEPI